MKKISGWLGVLGSALAAATIAGSIAALASGTSVRSIVADIVYPSATQPLGPALVVSGGLGIEVANAGSTGTTVNKLAILTGAPSTAVIATTSSTTGVIGLVVSGAGLTANGPAIILQLGEGACLFDGATTAGDYVIASTSFGGECHDGGSTPGSNQTLGRVLQTIGSAGSANIVMQVSPLGSGLVSAANGGMGINTASSTGVPVDASGTWSIQTYLPGAEGGFGINMGASSSLAAGILIFNGAGGFSSLTDENLVYTDATNVYTASPQSLGTQVLTAKVPNSSTGTILNELAKMNSSGQLLTTTVSDLNNVVGVIAANSGTSGSADVAQVGEVSCIFDNATTAGDYVQPSSGTAGNCHDAGSSKPTNGNQILGQVLSTHGGGGTYSMLVQIIPSVGTPVFSGLTQYGFGYAATTSTLGTTAECLSGQVPMGNGAGAPTCASIPGNSTILKPPTVQKFTSGSGTYTTPTSPAPLYIRVIAVGGGGGSGGNGTGGSNGSAGGTTTFGTSLITCNGGGGGIAAVETGASGGTATALGSGALGITLAGGDGCTGALNGAGVITSDGLAGGQGGSSAFGGAGFGGPGGNAGGAGKTNTGGGGGGAGSTSSFSTTGGGGAGAYVDATIAAPASTYSYAVGAAGSAGGAGSGVAGSAGGSGQLIVWEYYQ